MILPFVDHIDIEANIIPDIGSFPVKDWL